MPRKYKKRTRKKSAFSRKRSTAAQPRAAIADSQLIKLRYGSLVTIDPTFGTPISHVFSANSIFDPDRTGVGHQPLGHDQWATFYDHYTVIGSKITAQFMPTGDGPTTRSNSAVCSIMLKDDTTPVTAGTEEVLEQTGVVYKYLGQGSSGAARLKLVKKFSAKKFFNITDIKDNTQLSGKMGSSNPSEEAYYHVNVAPIDNTTDPSPVQVAVLIEYIVLLSERKDLVTS